MPWLVQQEEIEEVIFAYDKLDHFHVLELVAKLGEKRGVSFKVIAPESLSQSGEQLPLLSLEYLSPRGIGQSLRKISTLVLKKQ